MSNGGKFQKGNQLWRMVEFPGKPKTYTPEKLWEKFLEYMDTNSKISWDRDDFIKSGPDAGKIVSIEIPNPPSIRMFTIYAGISESTLFNYQKSTDYVAVVDAIKGSIQEIQIGGAATNILNSNIIARWAGLVDKKELDVKSDLTDDERADLIKSIAEKMRKS